MTEKEQKKREKDRRTNRTLLWRSIILMAIFGVLIFIPLLGKLWSIQIDQHDYYKELAAKQQVRELTVTPERGTIYDANGSPLAVSATAQNVIVSPLDIVELQKEYAEKIQKADEAVARGEKGDYPDYPEPTNEYIASGLSAILGVDKDKILEHLSFTSKQYREIAKQIDEDLAQEVREFIAENKLARGVYLQATSKRYYPYSSLASHVVGWVNSDNAGAYGLEALYEEELSGEAGRIIQAKNGKGTGMMTSYENFIDAIDGFDLHLTLDNTIQSMLESALLEGIETFDVQYGGFAIAMDPNTCAILGMASSPEYDLNNPRDIADLAVEEALEELKATAGEEEYEKQLGLAQLKQWRSKALNDTYEPGSTFKSMVVAAALEEGVVSLNDTFTCHGSVNVGGWGEIKCHNYKKGGHGTQTLAQAVENSCNPAFIAIGQRLGADKFYDYLERFGMIGTTGVDIPGEGSNQALVWPRSSMGTIELATASFGQRFQVSPIQLITGISSVINGGHLLQPYVVEKAVDNNGVVTYQHETTEVRQTISASTSQTVREILEGVVDGGTGKNAYTAGYRIGGKTGTSETLSEDDHNIVSFVGFAPANDPKVIVLLAYDGPKPVVPGSDYTEAGTFISGGNMAAPMAGKLIADILDYMGIERQYKPEELSGADTQVPNVTNHYMDYVTGALKKAGLTWRQVGEGDVVTGQIPAAGSYIPGGSEVVLYMGETEVPRDRVEVPDMMGRTPEQVQELLANAGLYLRASGATEYYVSSNTAISQSFAAGTMVDRGTVVEVRFSDGTLEEYAALEH